MLGLTLCIVHLMSCHKYKNIIHPPLQYHTQVSLPYKSMFLLFIHSWPPLSPWQPGLIISIVFPFPEWQIIRTIVVFEDWALSHLLQKFLRVFFYSLIAHFLHCWVIFHYMHHNLLIHSSIKNILLLPA